MTLFLLITFNITSTYGSDLMHEIVPLYGVAIVLFTIGALLRRAFGGKREILTLKLR
jgi:hypothetical protein